MDNRQATEKASQLLQTHMAWAVGRVQPCGKEAIVSALQMESLWPGEEQTLPCHTAAQLGYPGMAHKGEAVPRCREQNREHQARKARGPYASRLL